jgi:dynamin 1-like protein
MEKGSNCLDMLTGKLFPLKLGYIGAVCRSPNDVKLGKSLVQQRQDEKEFFEKHGSYGSISHLHGIPFLVKTLN